MNVRFQATKHFVKAHVPPSVYEVIRRIWRAVARVSSVKTRLYTMDRKLPTGFHVQQIRSLELRGISDDLLKSVIQDYLDFTAKHYDPALDAVRAVSLIEAVLKANDLSGDLAECGVYQGSSAKIIRHFAVPDKKLYLFDTFTGFTADDRQIEMRKGLRRDPGEGHIKTSLEFAKERVFSDMNGRKCEFNDNSVVFCVGSVHNTLETVTNARFSFVHLDMDLYEPTRFALEFFIPRIVSNGILLLHDYAVDKSGYCGVYQATMDVDLSGMFGPLPFGDQSTALFQKRT